MDDELNAFETELKRLRPAAPSVELAARVGRALAEPVSDNGGPARRAGWPWRLLWPAAAVLAFGAVWYSGRPAPDRVPAAAIAGSPLSPPSPVAAADEALKPVAARNVLVSARDEGVVTLDDGTVARRERLYFVDTITWRNPRTRASLEWSVPREEVRVVPVTFQ
jgi:hypothetical protein